MTADICEIVITAPDPDWLADFTRRLVENRLRLDAFKLNRIGAFAEGAVTRLKWGDHGGCLLARHTPNILVNGNSILVTWDEQARAWFECPACGRRCKHLYLDALACRICCRLDYASRHLHRSVPGVHRVMRWRRKIVDRIFYPSMGPFSIKLALNCLPRVADDRENPRARR